MISENYPDRVGEHERQAERYLALAVKAGDGRESDKYRSWARGRQLLAERELDRSRK